MKFQFDLLPQEYKSLPRDVFGMVLAVVAIAVSLSWTLTVYGRNTLETKSVQDEWEKADSELRQVNQELGQMQPPVADINLLKTSIDFINNNLDTPGTSLVDFLFALEKTVPEGVYIRDINPKDFTLKTGEYTIDGEATNLEEVLAFIAGLQQSGRFTRPFLKQNTTKVVGDATVTNFILTLTYVGKK
jgi:Tfp pilus assembly protein PilN